MFGSKESKNTEAEIINSSNTIGKGTVLTGDIETHGNLRIEGQVKGDVKTRSKLVLGHSSKITGNVFAKNAEVEGEVAGSVQVAELLILKSSAVIHGNVNTTKLVIEAGAQFNGSCKMGAGAKEIKINNQLTAKHADFKQEKARTV